MTEAERERAAIVAYLRETARQLWAQDCEGDFHLLDIMAGAIDRGKHLVAAEDRCARDMDARARQAAFVRE